MTGYVHAQNMLLFAQDALTHSEPWLLWESCESRTLRDGVWKDDWEVLEEMPDWHPNVQYRRKAQV